ncbi:MAG TPA: c-type cytochrome [Steroidobacteraceae bacterium]|nr:c-type cytochrome [Steroidobacteraceae bacterium]
MMKPGKFAMLAAAVCAPLAAWAVSTAQQDYTEAARAVPDMERGAALFIRCAACHGADAGGSDNGNVPRIAGQYPGVIIRQLVDYRYDKRVDPLMERVADGHLLQSAQQIADVAAFAAALHPQARARTGPGDHVMQGTKIYAARCSSCHGTSGQGNEEMLVPCLAGQNYAYLLRQLDAAVEGRRPQLAGSHAGYLQDLDQTAVQGLADALSRMGGGLGAETTARPGRASAPHRP